MKREISFAILICLFAAVPSWATETQYHYQWILDLYPAGKVVEARKAVLAEVEKQAKAASDRKAANLMEMEMKLGIVGMANLVMYCLRTEAEHGKAAGAPEELFKAADLAVRAVDAAIEESQGFPPDGVRKYVAYAQSQRTALLLAWAAGLRAAGRIDEAAALEKKHALAAVQPPPQPQVEKVSGVAIRIGDLLRRYYEALSKEDSKGLDAVLFQGEGCRTGRDIVAEIRKERETEHDFDEIGPVTFDVQTLLTITRSDTGYRVRIDALLKSYVVKGKVVEKREVEHFTIVSGNGEFRIAVKAGAK